jgi:hypothetical protein
MYTSDYFCKCQKYEKMFQVEVIWYQRGHGLM